MDELEILNRLAKAIKENMDKDFERYWDEEYQQREWMDEFLRKLLKVVKGYLDYPDG